MTTQQIVQELEDLQATVTKAQREKDELSGAYNSTMELLKKTFNITSYEDAETLLAAKEKEVEVMVSRIAARITKIEAALQGMV